MNTKNFQGSLLSDTTRVAAPFIKVDIGGYSFGVYEEQQRAVGNNGIWRNVSAKYPNYIQSLNIKKINGTVNTYNLNFVYPITKEADPNFFEKIFSRVSSSRRITFTYGDSMLPEDVYANEEAIITKVTQNLSVRSAQIVYNVTAIGDTAVGLASQHSWPARRERPSKVIAEVLNDRAYHLTEIFYGMKNKNAYDFIDSDDQIVNIPTITNKSIMDYIATLVSYMVPNGASRESVNQGNIYSLATFEDTTGEYGGPYFEVRKIVNSGSDLNKLCSYVIDIGYPTANIVEDFSLKTDNNWSIFYEYNREASSIDYVKRLNSRGELEYIYNPQLTNGKYDLEENEKTWWTRVTEFPVEATIKIRGLLRPAILMNYVKINVWFYGNKHLSSGYYLITGEEDNIGTSGYHTTLSLIRVAGEGESNYDSASIWTNNNDNNITGVLNTGIRSIADLNNNVDNAPNNGNGGGGGGSTTLVTNYRG